MPSLVSTLVAVPILKLPDHRLDLMVADLGAALRDQDADGRLVRLDRPDRVLHVGIWPEVFEGDDVAVLVIAAVEVHRRPIQARKRPLGLMDEQEAQLALPPYSALPPSMLTILRCVMEISFRSLTEGARTGASRVTDRFSERNAACGGADLVVGRFSVRRQNWGDRWSLTPQSGATMGSQREITHGPDRGQ